MVVKFRFLFFRSLIIILFTVCFIQVGQAQEYSDSTNFSIFEKSDIKWVSEWPSIESKKKTKKTKDRIKDFILGKKPVNLSKPVSIITSNQNTFWILDQGNKAIVNVNDGIAEIPHFIEKKKFDFNSLVSVCFLPDNYILFTDSYLKKIFQFNPVKKEFKALNDSLKLEQPTGIAYSQVNNEIWVVETNAHRVSILNSKGVFIRSIGNRGNAPGEFNFPTYIWIDKNGKVYIVDSMNFRIQVFDNDGKVLSVFGTNGDATGYFARPKGIATDSYGNIYIADALFHVVQIFDINGKFLYKFGTQGHNEGEFWMPTGVFVDDKDYIYVADSYNSRVQVFQLINGNKK